jgi:hypothetical protein
MMTVDSRRLTLVLSPCRHGPDREFHPVCLVCNYQPSSTHVSPPHHDAKNHNTGTFTAGEGYSALPSQPYHNVCTPQLKHRTTGAARPSLTISAGEGYSALPSQPYHKHCFLKQRQSEKRLLRCGSTNVCVWHSC